MNKSQKQEILSTFSQPFEVFLQTERQISLPTLLNTLTSEIPTLLYTWWGMKKVPLSGGASPYRPL